MIALEGGSWTCRQVLVPYDCFRGRLLNLFDKCWSRMIALEGGSWTCLTSAGPYDWVRGRLLNPCDMCWSVWLLYRKAFEPVWQVLVHVKAFETVWQVLVRMIALKWGFWTYVISAWSFDCIKMCFWTYVTSAWIYDCVNRWFWTLVVSAWIYDCVKKVRLWIVLFVCLILFFTSTQQSFSYAGRVFLGWTSTKLG